MLREFERASLQNLCATKITMQPTIERLVEIPERIFVGFIVAVVKVLPFD